MAKVQIISKREAFEVAIGESVFVLRRLHRDVPAESRRRHTKRGVPDEPGGQPRDEVDEEAVNDDIVDYIIQDWRGVCGPDVQEVPCTLENKLALPAPAIVEIMSRCRAANTEGDLVLAVKNLKPSSAAPAGGGQTPGG